MEVRVVVEVVEIEVLAVVEEVEAEVRVAVVVL